MKEVIIATKNAGKLKEFEAILTPLNYKVESLLDFPDSIDVDETGDTFEENAILKAEAIAKQYNKMTIADDSGLAIDYLNGRPGIYSARYAGPEKNDLANITKVLRDLCKVSNLEERSARFVCALALAVPGQITETVRGTCEGYIAHKPLGDNGFGYDPIFIVKGLDVTMAHLSKDEKNKISHRAVALNKLLEVIKQL